MIQSLLNGFSQLRDPSAKKVVLISVGASVLTYIFLFGFINLTLNHTSLFQVRWIESFSDLLGHFAAVMLTWLLFPATISAIIGLFLENIASAVEARHYPDLPPISNPPLFSSLVISGKFLNISRISDKYQGISYKSKRFSWEGGPSATSYPEARY